MSDITQGQDNVSDDSLFRDVVDATTLEKFENPELPKSDIKSDIKPDKPGDKPAADAKTEKPADKEPEPAVPAGRLREESESRRRAEQERDDLRARLAALERQAPQHKEPPKKVDIFDNPSGFVRQEVEPLLTQFQNELRNTREAMSLDNAIARQGDEFVMASRQALEQGMARNDPGAWATYNRAMAGHDPYGVITKWHRERETVSKVGSDLDAYNKSVLEKALDDPEYQKRVIERAQAVARGNGNIVNRPARSAVPNVPSLANVGAGGGDEQVQEPSDDQLFRQAVSAKRR